MSITKLLTDVQSKYDELETKYQQLKTITCPSVLPVKIISSAFHIKEAHRWFISDSSYGIRLLPEFSINGSYSAIKMGYAEKRLLDAQLAKALAEVEVIRSKMDASHAENAVALHTNNLVYDSVSTFMKNAGFPESYTVYELPSPKHRNKQHVKKTAGWLTDLQRECKRTDGYEQACRVLSEYTAKVMKFHTEFCRQAALNDARIERECMKKRQELGIMKLAAKYLPEGTEEWEASDIIRAMTEKDKYLDLAYAMEQTRGDWSSGFYRVEDALNGFEVVTEADKEIHDEIMSLMEQEDGRVFRDCNNNYSVVYGLVEPSLLADFLKVCEYENL